MRRTHSLLYIFAALTYFFVAHTSHAQNLMGVKTLHPGETPVTKQIEISLNKSLIIDLDREAADVVITNPEIADVSVQTATRLIFRGVEIGQTNAFVFDRKGAPLLNLEIIVEIDTRHAEALIRKYVPSSRIKIEALSGSIIVSGSVENLSQADQVMRIITAFAADEETNIVNMMSVEAKDQVMLQVRIVEMQRNVVKQLGIDLSAQGNFRDLSKRSLQPIFQNGFPLFFDPESGQFNTNGVGNAIEQLAPTTPFANQFGISTTNNFNVAGSALGGLSAQSGYQNYVGLDILQTSVGAQIDALERVGMVRTLAEPNIVAVSGESAKFLAGGEFPVPVAQDETGRISVEFKNYGVGLGFTPFVLSAGRISLRISTEISELSTNGAFQSQPTTINDPNTGNVISIPGLSIPALQVRSVESTVELPSGASTMLAGLIQSRSRQVLDQLPGLKDLPIIGSLFQSRDFINEETEMVVIITPYLVDPTTQSALRTPADGYVNASDLKTVFFGKLNSQYAHGDKGLTPDNYSAPVGFMEE